MPILLSLSGEGYRMHGEEDMIYFISPLPACIFLYMEPQHLYRSALRRDLTFGNKTSYLHLAKKGKKETRKFALTYKFL